MNLMLNLLYVVIPLYRLLFAAVVTVLPVFPPSGTTALSEPGCHY